MPNETDKNITKPEGYELKFYNEETEEVSLNIPRETYRVMEKIAKDRSLPVKALLRMHLGHGMRLDLAENYPELAKELFEKRFRNRKNIAAEKKDADVDIAA